MLPDRAICIFRNEISREIAWAGDPETKIEKVDDRVRVRHALISVSDKQGLDLLVKGLLRVVPSLKIFSTGGTYARIVPTASGKMAIQH